MLLLAGCGGGGGIETQSSALTPTSAPIAEFSQALVGSDCKQIQLTSTVAAATGVMITNYAWKVVPEFGAALTQQGAGLKSPTFTVPSCGKIRIELTVSDSAGSSTTVSSTIDTAALVPKVISMAFTPSSGKVGETVTIQVVGSNLPATVQLGMTDASCTAPTAVSAMGFTTVCTPSSLGLKKITVTSNILANSGFVLDESRSFNVEAAGVTPPGPVQPPTAEFSHALVGGDCKQIQLTSTAVATTGATISNYAWKITPESGPALTQQGATLKAPMFTVPGCGKMVIELAVRDSAGNSATRSLTVDTAALAPKVTSMAFAPSGGKVGETVRIQVSGANLPTTVQLGMADASCTAPTAVTAAGFTTACTPSTSGLKNITVMSNTVANAGFVLDESHSFNVAPALAASTLPHSGITTSQCYTVMGDSALGACSSATQSLFGVQDGDRASVNPMSYGNVGNYPATSCVKDNVTGLIWEGKDATGPRAGTNNYSNYHSSFGSTQAQMDAATNSYGYVAYVNSTALCGYTDWRLPTADELESIVDYSKSYPGPTINITWFPNSADTGYWTSSPQAGRTAGAWLVYFGSAGEGPGLRTDSAAVRLVRASP